MSLMSKELGKEVLFMQPEEQARLVIDGKLEQSLALKSLGFPY